MKTRRTGKRILSWALTIAMLIGLLTGMGLTAYATATEYTSLKQGDVLHLGDTINTSTNYKVCGGYLEAKFQPATLVRGHIGIRGINESETGNCYLLKNKNGSYYGAIITPDGYKGGYWPVLDTSDGISVTAITPDGHWTELTFAIHEAPAHTHSFTYAASGATITATCGGSGTCDITEGLTLTISAPTGNLIYDGTTTYPATLSTGYNTTAFPGTYSISYTKDGSAYSGVPKDAGTYTASVTAGTGDGAKTASVAYKKVDGKEQTLVQSVATHTVTHDGKTTAIKSVEVNKTEVTLKKDETFQIKAKVTKENKNKKIDQHRPICYESSNEKIVTVNDKGKVTAKKKGKAKVFVYCENGSYKKIQFTVK